MTLCILHLGAEKTGTSSIQKYLGVHREALLGEGLWYPESFTNPSGHVHLKLSGAAVDGSLDPSNPQGVAFRAELDRALKRGAKTVVFSSEFFHSELRDKGAVERLKAFLSAYFDRFKLVYYARRQDQMLASMHSTAIQGDGPQIRGRSRCTSRKVITISTMRPSAICGPEGSVARIWFAASSSAIG